MFFHGRLRQSLCFSCGTATLKALLPSFLGGNSWTVIRFLSILLRVDMKLDMSCALCFSPTSPKYMLYAGAASSVGAASRHGSGLFSWPASGAGPVGYEPAFCGVDPEGSDPALTGPGPDGCEPALTADPFAPVDLDSEGFDAAAPAATTIAATATSPETAPLRCG